MLEDWQLLGDRLTALRHERGMTQDQLAWLAGHTPKTIRDIERSRSHPYLDTVGDIAWALRIDLDLLVARVT